MDKLIFPEWDTQLFTWINSRHLDRLDPIMQVISSHYSWIILFFIVAFFMVKQSRFWGTREILLITSTVAINSVLNNVLKVIIKRPRPCHEESLQSTIHLLEDCGTHYSFFSAHSSNAFCLAICTAMFFRNKHYSILIIMWATIVAYSRIYVGKHYPLDVICGVTFGIVMSYTGNMLLKRYRDSKLENARK